MLSLQTRRVLLFASLGLSLGLGAAALVVVPRAGWSTNDVTTGRAPGYPDLQNRVYDMPPVQTLQFARAAIALLPRWRLVSASAPTGSTLRAQVRTVVGGFVDDVFVEVTPAGPNNDASRVVIRSRSRVGRADLGENARHIRALQAAMDNKLPLLR